MSVEFVHRNEALAEDNTKTIQHIMDILEKIEENTRKA